ncbi:hypothetical protein AAG906_035559 [Vitis piasezkii]
MENSTRADDSGMLPQILHGLQTFPTCTTKPSSHAMIVEDKKREESSYFFKPFDSMAIDYGERATMSQVVRVANGIGNKLHYDISLAGHAQVEKLKSKLGFEDMEVSEEDGLWWRVTGFYGFPDRSQRHLSWNLLGLSILLPLFHGIVWVTLIILFVMKKKRRVPHPPWLIRGFVKLFRKGRKSSPWVEECLDQALVNVSWLNFFSNAKLNNLVAPISDHSPIELVTVDKFYCVYKHRFRFENGWLKEDGLDFVVSNAWKSPHAFKNKISHYKRCIEQYRDKDGLTDGQVLKAYKAALSNVLMQEEFLK